MKSEGQRNRLLKAIRYVPIFLTLLTLISFLSLPGLYLSPYSKSFAQEFYTQNEFDLSSGNTLALTQRLNQLSSLEHVIKVSATRDSQLFFSRTNEPLSLFPSTNISVVSPGATNIKINFDITIPQVVRHAIIFISCAILLFVLLLYLVTRWTEQARYSLERERSAAQIKIIEVATQVAHDIRSPLAALDIAASSFKELPEDKRLLLKSAALRIHDIANQLIEKSREGRNTSTSEKVSTHLLPALIEQLLSEKRLQHRANLNIQIESRIDKSSYGIFATLNPGDLFRILSNLVNNSVEAFDSASGRVLITLKRNGSFAVITVQDNGKGIPSDILSKLGTRGETHGKSGGTGLGLFHARTTVESWGGAFDIQSTAGQGTTVTLRIPAAPAPQWFASEIVLRPNQKLVVLDDDSTIHHIWEGRAESIQAHNSNVGLVHLSNPESFRNYVKHENSQDTLYLVDYELLGHQDTGLSLAEELNILPQTILVTSRFEEPFIRERCEAFKVKMIPKGAAGFVPIRIEHGSSTTIPNHIDAVLIDDDTLVHRIWQMQAHSRKKQLKCFSSFDDFQKSQNEFALDTAIYVDVTLANNVSGETVARQLHEHGFQNIYLATGHNKDLFAHLKFLKGVCGKDPPW